MQNKGIKKYIGMLIFAILVIGIYKSWNTEFLGKLMGLLTPLFIGIVLAYLLYFPSAKLERLINKIPNKLVRKSSRLVSILTAYVVVGALLYAAIRLLVPVLLSNLTSLISQIPSAVENLITFLETHEIMGYSLDRSMLLDSIVSTLSVDKILSILNLESIIGYVEGIVSVSGTFIDILIGIIISIYLILDREDFFKVGNRLLSCIFRPEVKNAILKYIRKINEFIARYIYCRLLDALIMFFISLGVLLILDIPYALILATVVALFNIVPYIGSILSTIVLIVVTLFTEGFNRAVLIGIVMFILQQIDGNVIAPYLVKDRLKINPVMVLVAVIVGGGFGGIIGIMLGVPIIAVVRLIADDLMHRQEVLAKYKKRHGNEAPTAYFGSGSKE